MKFAIDIGHNAPSKDTGAIGVNQVREDDLTREVGERLIELLEAADHQVIRTAPKSCSSVNQSLRHRCSVANNAKADTFVSIHFNAFNNKAYGAEVYAASKIGRGIGRSILDEICELGFYDRGVKNANFYVLKNTTMPAVLVECCFCDSEKDMKLFDPLAMALAIAEGLIGDLAPIDDELRTLRITANTWLKATTEQSEHLPPSQKVWMEVGKYQVLAALPEEEGHHFIRLQNGTEGFIFAGHCEVS